MLDVFIIQEEEEKYMEYYTDDEIENYYANSIIDEGDPQELVF